jgi:hypothetical protein
MAAKRYITVPEPVEIRGFDGEWPRTREGDEVRETVAMQLFVRLRTVDEAFPDDRCPHPQSPGAFVGVWTPVVLQSAATLRELFRGKAAGELVELDEDDYRRLLRATESPAPPGYDRHFGHLLLPFVHAVADAKRERPAVTQPKESNGNGRKEKRA